MNTGDITFIKVHEIAPDGSVSSVQYEVDNMSQEFIMKTAVASNFNMEQYIPSINCDKLIFKYPVMDMDNSSIRVIKIGGIEDLHPISYATEIATAFTDPHEFKPLICNNNIVQPKRESKIPNIPTMIICQNCDTNFPTKYQYQRHQCEFNAEKVVLKPNIDIKDIDKGMRMKFDCPTCGKQFVSKNNLERHQTSHDDTNINVCEHCNKQFVSENRLRIHKENHCKKAGDISKFYRSDVTVWKCISCYQVFATPSSAVKHVENCIENINVPTPGGKDTSDDSCKILNDEIKTLSQVVPELVEQGGCFNGKSDLSSTKNVQKFLTELLLQCEYCNRTYADKKWLLAHQKQHTTDVNYECITCNETFDSYVSASKHWLTKCSDEANLFYLPKLTYCEFCDRTFKSHEILYTHKFKKKHYTPKVYNSLSSKDLQGNPKENTLRIVENKEAIVKLIEDVLCSMNSNDDDKEIDDDNSNKENADGSCTDIVIKSEVCSESSSFSKSDMSQDGEKKKRGRKSKSPKQTESKDRKNKRVNAVVDDGFKYQCERCVTVWDSVADLENHREVEHPAKFKCEECDQVVHSAKALLIHCRAHQSLKPYVCEICKRCYSQTSHLWQHMRFHQGIKPFACPHEGCEARYTIRPDLKDHIRKVHTRERPFKCSVCDKCFLTGSVYYQHRLIHTNDRRYGCDICQKRFFRADALNNHRRIHTDERPYPCDICGRQFRQKGDRNKHVRTQHVSISDKCC